MSPARCLQSVHTRLPVLSHSAAARRHHPVRRCILRYTAAMSVAVSSATAAAQKPAGFRRFWRALKQLLHEIVGAIFAVLALMWFNLAIRAWTRGATSRWIIAAACVLALSFVVFAWTSFRRARKL